MTWFRLDDAGWCHPKVIAAGNRAFGAWCRAGQWSSSQLADGFVAASVARLIEPATAVWGALLTAGLITRCEGGYRIHDFLAYNPSRAQVEAKRAAQREGGKVGAMGRWGAQPNRSTHGLTHGSTNGVGGAGTHDDQNGPGPARPVPSDLLSAPVPHSAPTTSTATAVPAIASQGEQPKKRAPRKPNPERPAGHTEVVGTYFAAFEHARGVKPSFGGKEGNAVSRLLDAVKGDVAQARAIVESAYSDPWWSTRATILDIAKDPAKFLGRQPSLVQRSPAGHLEAVLAREAREREQRIAELSASGYRDCLAEAVADMEDK